MPGMRRALWVGTFLAIAVTLGARPAFAQRFHVANEAEQGERVSEANCITCHGLEGDEVPGIDFGKGRFRRVNSDADLVRIIKEGVPGTAMPPNKLPDVQLANLVTYLRSLTATEPLTALPGDASRGQALVEGKGNCLTCHRIEAKGSRLGPDLTDVGQFRRRVEIEKAIMDPGAEVRPENRSYRVVTRDGVTTVGRLLNHDTLMVLLIDDKQQLRAFNKADLRSHGFVLESPMPSYKGKISTDELADVVRYLASLKGIKTQTP
jgi:putative heme-binding domain-containing protein